MHAARSQSNPMPAFACISTATDRRSSRGRAPRSWRSEMHACTHAYGREDRSNEVAMRPDGDSAVSPELFGRPQQCVVLVLSEKSERSIGRFTRACHAWRMHARPRHSRQIGLTDRLMDGSISCVYRTYVPPHQWLRRTSSDLFASVNR